MINQHNIDLNKLKSFYGQFCNANIVNMAAETEVAERLMKLNVLKNVEYLNDLEAEEDDELLGTVVIR